MRFIDRTGDRYGKLEVVKLVKRQRSTWLCLCDCGNHHIARASNLINGHVQSCGCSRHGQTESITYTSWAMMRNRCKNPNNTNYPNYGGRGITVCERWDDFMNFLADMGERPSQEYSIGRINNNGNYCPGNCRWETVAQQNNNKRRTRRGRFLTHNGETLRICDWAEKVGIHEATLSHRIRAGWPIELALTQPITPSRSMAGKLSVIARRMSSARIIPSP